MTDTTSSGHSHSIHRRTGRLPLAAFLLAAGLLLSSAFAQLLPANAQEAVDRGEQFMAQALATYATQYPDRPLWQSAFREGQTAVSLAPGNPAALHFLAEAYSRANWTGPAAENWEKFIAAGGTLSKEDAELFANAGIANAYSAYQRGDLEAAAELYLQVTQHVPNNLEATRWLGRILLELQRPEQAVAAWRTLTELDPSDAGAQYFLQLSQAQARWGIDAANAFFQGVRTYEDGEMVQARLAFANATVRNDKYTEAWAWLGRVAFEQGHFEDAHSAYSRAVSLAPNNDTYTYFEKESQRRMAGQ